MPRHPLLGATFLVYGIAHIVIASANGVRPSGEVRQGHDLISILSGVALYGVMTQRHPVLIGVPGFQLS